MGCIRLKFLTGFFINTFVKSNHNDFVPTSEKLLGIDVKAFIILRNFSKDILNNRIRSNENAITGYIWKALTFPPFNLLVKNDQRQL